MRTHMRTQAKVYANAYANDHANGYANAMLLRDQSTYVPNSNVRVLSDPLSCTGDPKERSPLRGSLAREDRGKEQMPPVATPTFRLLCVMVHHVLDRLGPDADPSAVIDALKWDLARAQLPSPPPHHFEALFEAVTMARAKGYRTPRRRA